MTPPTIILRGLALHIHDSSRLIVAFPVTGAHGSHHAHHHERHRPWAVLWDSSKKEIAELALDGQHAEVVGGKELSVIPRLYPQMRKVDPALVLKPGIVDRWPPAAGVVAGAIRVEGGTLEGSASALRGWRLDGHVPHAEISLELRWTPSPSVTKVVLDTGTGALIAQENQTIIVGNYPDPDHRRSFDIVDLSSTVTTDHHFLALYDLFDNTSRRDLPTIGSGPNPSSTKGLPPWAPTTSTCFGALFP